MKRVRAFFLALLFLTGLCGNALAMEFVESPGHYEPIKIPVDGDAGLLLVITPVFCKQKSMLPEIREMLDSAEKQVLEAANVTVLTEDSVRALEEMKDASTDSAIKELEIENLFVLDLFDVSLIRNGVNLEHVPENQALSFSVKTKLTQDDAFFILHNFSGEEWEVVDLYELHDDGVLDIALFGLSPIAIIVGRFPKTRDDAPVSPQTGESSDYTAAYVGGACAAVGMSAAVYFLCRRRKAE